jgi:hypothetical protein
MLLAQNFNFVFCSLPFCILNIKYRESSSGQPEPLSLLIIHILVYSNNSVNIIFYLLFSQKYWQTFRKHILCFKTDSTPTSSGVNTSKIRQPVNLNDINNLKNNISKTQQRGELQVVNQQYNSIYNSDYDVAKRRNALVSFASDR